MIASLLAHLPKVGFSDAPSSGPAIWFAPW